MDDMVFDTSCNRLSLIKRLEKEADFYKDKDPGLVLLLKESIYNLQKQSEMIVNLEAKNERLKNQINSYDDSIKRFTEFSTLSTFAEYI